MMDADDIISGKRWASFIIDRLDDVATSVDAERAKHLNMARTNTAILAEILGCDLVGPSNANSRSVETADEIDRLQAENDRLRAELADIKAQRHVEVA